MRCPFFYIKIYLWTFLYCTITVLLLLHYSTVLHYCRKEWRGYTYDYAMIYLRLNIKWWTYKTYLVEPRQHSFITDFYGMCAHILSVIVHQSPLFLYGWIICNAVKILKQQILKKEIQKYTIFVHKFLFFCLIVFTMVLWPIGGKLPTLGMCFASFTYYGSEICAKTRLGIFKAVKVGGREPVTSSTNILFRWKSV